METKGSQTPMLARAQWWLQVQRRHQQGTGHKNRMQCYLALMMGEIHYRNPNDE
jgi:hypothetical protein